MEEVYIYIYMAKFKDLIDTLKNKYNKFKYD